MSQWRDIRDGRLRGCAHGERKQRCKAEGELHFDSAAKKSVVRRAYKIGRGRDIASNECGEAGERAERVLRVRV